MNIRKLNKTDFGRIAQITEAAWGNKTMYKLLEDRHGIIGGSRWQDKKIKDILDFCEKTPSNVIVAEQDGIIAGYASFSQAGTIGNILDNAVSPDFQGKGIGTTLNKWILDYFQSCGIKIVRVSTMEHDSPARRVYEKNGFKEIAKTIHYSMEL